MALPNEPVPLNKTGAFKGRAMPSARVTLVSPVSHTVPLVNTAWGGDGMTQLGKDWRRLHALMRDGILSGALKPGARLPTQSDLCGRHNMSRHAVRMALAALERDGLVHSWQGKGSYVRSARVSYAIGPSTRFTNNLRAAGLEPGLRFLRALKKSADAEQARLLHVPLGERLLIAELVRLADDAPLVLARHCVIASRFPRFGTDVRDTRSISKALSRGGVETFRRASTVIETRLGTQHETSVLEIAPAQPVLISTAVNVDNDERPVELSVAISRGDRLSFSVTSHARSGPLSVFNKHSPSR